MARLIKSEKEVEGRYEEVWTLVEEDALVQWPAGPGAVVGRDAPRLDGYEKARGEARYTGDIKLPGMLESALLRSPYARAKVRRIDLAAAAAAPGVLGVVGPGEVAGIEEEAHFEGAAVAGVAAETLAQARAALELIEVEWEELEPLLDADEAVARGSLLQESRRYERGDYEQGLAQADAVVEAEYTTQTLNHNPLETHQCVCEWRGDSLDVYVSTQYIWGLRSELAEAPRPAPGQGAGDLRVHGRRLRGQERRWATTSRSRPSWRSGRSGRCAARSPAARRTSSAATATPRASA